MTSRCHYTAFKCSSLTWPSYLGFATVDDLVAFKEID